MIPLLKEIDFNYNLADAPIEIINSSLDFVELLYNNIKDYEEGDFHSFYNHNHFIFSETDKYKNDFRLAVNQIFDRNKINMTLTQKGNIEIKLNELLKQSIDNYKSFCEDEELNKLINTAIEKISNRHFNEQMLAIKELWDAFERLKTLTCPNEDKKHSADRLIQNICDGDEKIKQILSEEFNALTKIGNGFNIRHNEVNKHIIHSNITIEYLFHRMFALIHLCLKNYIKE